MVQDSIGKLIKDVRQKDAIHIAVVPVIATERLYPAQMAALVEGSQCRVAATAKDNAIGIIDPFLTAPVYPDQECWLFLFPNTITGMRHEWEHPAFTSRSVTASESMKWMERTAARHYAPYENDRQYTAADLIQAGKDYLESGEYFTQQGSESLRDEINAREFWTHFQNITGIIVPSDELDVAPFSCSC
jgi:hypothetical protein